jgi:hypothetical protein
MMTRLFRLVVVVMVVLLAGCGSYWEDQGAASRTAAEARLRQAEAERGNARAAIIDAEARGALAQSQARALNRAMDANVDLTRQAVAMADDGEYVMVLALVALGALGLAATVVMMQLRRPVVERGAEPMVVSALPALPARGLTIETRAGRVRLVQEPEETRYHFMLRVREVAGALEAQALLDAPKDGG